VPLRAVADLIHAREGEVVPLLLHPMVHLAVSRAQLRAEGGSGAVHSEDLRQVALKVLSAHVLEGLRRGEEPRLASKGQEIGEGQIEAPVILPEVKGERVVPRFLRQAVVGDHVAAVLPQEDELLADLIRRNAGLAGVVAVPPPIHPPPEAVSLVGRGQAQREDPDQHRHAGRLSVPGRDLEPAGIEPRRGARGHVNGRPELLCLARGNVDGRPLLEEGRQAAQRADDAHVQMLGRDRSLRSRQIGGGHAHAGLRPDRPDTGGRRLILAGSGKQPQPGRTGCSPFSRLPRLRTRIARHAVHGMTREHDVAPQPSLVRRLVGTRHPPRRWGHVRGVGGRDGSQDTKALRDLASPGARETGSFHHCASACRRTTPSPRHPIRPDGSILPRTGGQLDGTLGGSQHLSRPVLQLRPQRVAALGETRAGQRKAQGPRLRPPHPFRDLRLPGGDQPEREARRRGARRACLHLHGQRSFVAPHGVPQRAHGERRRHERGQAQVPKILDGAHDVRPDGAEEIGGGDAGLRDGAGRPERYPCPRFPDDGGRDHDPPEAFFPFRALPEAADAQEDRPGRGPGLHVDRAGKHQRTVRRLDGLHRHRVAEHQNDVLPEHRTGVDLERPLARSPRRAGPT
jgi:hypothetical protein